MERKRNIRLITKILAVGLVIAVLSYLFHPEVGQLSVMHNGQPIADPLLRFAAFPTFLVIMGLAAILTFMLFLGIGVFIFMGTLFVALMVSAVIAPYFWPVLLIIFLIIGLMSFSHEDKG
jgi:energy-converting hydrogenase Eha subunit A